ACPDSCYGVLTTRQCQNGSCNDTQILCGNGSDCQTPDSCSCADIFSCQLQPNGGPCNWNDACSSKVCGTTGSVGHCCKTVCVPGGGECGATDCDANGECVFPGLQQTCGISTCDNDNQLTTDRCDGMGACSTKPVTAACPGNFACANASSCYT